MNCHGVNIFLNAKLKISFFITLGCSLNKEVTSHVRGTCRELEKWQACGVNGGGGGGGVIL